MSDVGTAGTSGSEQATAGGTAGGTPAGWYPDPQGAMRWWDGSAWTSHVTAGAATSVSRTATILSTPGPDLPPGATGSRLPRLPRLDSLPTPPQLSRRTWVVVGAVAAVLVLLAGYLLFGRGGDDASSLSGPVVHTVPPQQLVRQVAFTDADLKGGLRTSMPKGGDQVKGQVTFDLCGYRYKSEAHRVARRQVLVLDAERRFTGMSNEVVVYDSVASATRALTELRTALAHCPHTYVRDAVAPHPQVLYSAVKSRSFTSAQVPHPGETFDEFLYATDTVHVKAPATTFYESATVIRRGTLVDVVWFVSPAPYTAEMTRVVATVSDASARKIPATGIPTS